MKLFLLKTEGGDLIGLNDRDQAYIARIKPGEYLEADTQKVRNPDHHNKFFALFTAALRSQDKYPETEAGKKAMMVELKIRAGWYDEHVNADGKLVYVPRSISWARMGQDEFDVFYADAVIALAQMCNSDEVIAEADEIIAKRAA
jgi:hypothetical protein